MRIGGHVFQCPTSSSSLLQVCCCAEGQRRVVAPEPLAISSQLPEISEGCGCLSRPGSDSNSSQTSRAREAPTMNMGMVSNASPLQASHYSRCFHSRRQNFIKHCVCSNESIDYSRYRSLVVVKLYFDLSQIDIYHRKCGYSPCKMKRVQARDLAGGSEISRNYAAWCTSADFSVLLRDPRDLRVKGRAQSYSRRKRGTSRNYANSYLGI